MWVVELLLQDAPGIALADTQAVLWQAQAHATVTCHMASESNSYYCQFIGHTMAVFSSDFA
jgi:hypothetical protein